MKKEIRVIGIDDSPFDKFSKDKEIFVIGTIFRGGSWLDGVISTKITVDGDDATSRLITMINTTKFKAQLQCILLDGIALGGFNVVDIKKLFEKTGIPVVVVIRRRPDIGRIEKTLYNLGKKNKMEFIKNAGPPVRIGKIYVQFKGTDIGNVQEILRITCTRSLIPEPIRSAHIIAQGIYFGESRGAA